jgi:hypothetical protein
MKKFVARAAAVLSAAAVSVAMFGTGFANADSVKGQTYEDAAAYLSGTRNKTVVIATVVGDQLETNRCIVTSWKLDNNDKKQALVNLNCNSAVATAGSAGNSAASPAGIKALKDEKNAKSLAQDSSICDTSAALGEWCAGICSRTQLCDYTVS